VEGDLLLGYSFIESLGELTFVDGNLDLWYCQNIKTLGNIVGVQGNLWLGTSPIESLGNLEFVNGNFSLYNCQNIKTLGKLKRVKYVLSLANLSIESLGELEFVGEDLVIDTNIPQSELNNVEVVGDIYR
jgi:hypothetical protein